MYPLIGHIGPVTLYSFGLMLAVAVIFCSFLLSRDAKAFEISREMIFDFVFWVILGGIIGARIFFIILNFSSFAANPQEIIMITNGGLAWQGGLILGGLSGLLFVRIKKLPLTLMLDLCAPYLALGQAIGRIGCFLNGCCYGKHASWGMYFPVHQSRLQPTQLYDAVMLVAIYFFLKILQKKSLIRAEVFAVYLMLASAERFINEFFRADHVKTVMGLSVFQFVSVGIFFLGFSLYQRLRQKSKTV